MSEVPPGPEDPPQTSMPDGTYKISSVHSPLDGLAPKDEKQPADQVVIARNPTDDRNFLTWKLVKWGKTPDKYDIVTLEYELKPNLFLSYDFANKSVVLKNDRQPAWVLIPNIGAANQYKIALLTSWEMLLTYTKKDTEVQVEEESGNDNDKKRYLWNFQK